MKHIDWKSDYILGNGTVDLQHKKIFSIINSLFAAHHNGDMDLVLEVTLDELKKICIVTFF